MYKWKRFKEFLIQTKYLIRIEARSFAINSLAIQISCYQPHLLSKHLLSNSFTINSVAITLICYPASFPIRCQLLSTHLLSSLTCYQANLLYQSSVAVNNFAFNHHLLSNFRLPLNPYFFHFFLLKTAKNGKLFENLEFFILWQTLRGHGTGSLCCLK